MFVSYDLLFWNKEQKVNSYLKKLHRQDEKTEVEYVPTSLQSMSTYAFNQVSTEWANVFMALNSVSSHIRLLVNLPVDMFFPSAGYKAKGNVRLNKLNASGDK